MHQGDAGGANIEEQQFTRSTVELCTNTSSTTGAAARMNVWGKKCKCMQRCATCAAALLSGSGAARIKGLQNATALNSRTEIWRSKQNPRKQREARRKGSCAQPLEPKWGLGAGWPGVHIGVAWVWSRRRVHAVRRRLQPALVNLRMLVKLRSWVESVPVSCECSSSRRCARAPPTSRRMQPSCGMCACSGRQG
jgi:hypothetical protein